MRLFVGVEIPGDVAAELYPLARGIKGLDAQTPNNMHITLNSSAMSIRDWLPKSIRPWRQLRLNPLIFRFRA